MVANASNLSTGEAEVCRPLNSRPAWSTQQVPGQHRESLCLGEMGFVTNTITEVLLHLLTDRVSWSKGYPPTLNSYPPLRCWDSYS